MKYLRKLVYCVAAVSLVAAAVLFLLRQQSRQAEQDPVQPRVTNRQNSVTTRLPQGPSLAEPAKFNQESTVAAAAPVTPETAATRRMYASHAPLRTASLANPDSDANRKILETMVHKALTRNDDLKK